MISAPGKSAYLTTMIGLATAAFGMVAALAWNAAITELFKAVFGQAGGIVGLFVYAIVVTAIAVLVMVNLAKMAERAAPPEKKE
jgi:hypothetical protein